MAIMTASELLPPKEVSRRYPALSETYLQKLRLSGKGPAYAKPTGRRVIYSVADIEMWLAASRVNSTSEAA